MKAKKTAVTLSIIIPVKNEGLNIKILLKVLVAILETTYEILIVHDSLDDDSITVVRKIQSKNTAIQLIHNKLGSGVAKAIKSGINASSGKYILIFAADEIGPVLAVEDMIALLEKGCDLVSCTRYAHGGRRLGGSVIQGFLSRAGNRIFRFVVGTTLTDSTTGIKMFRREIFDELFLESNVGWAILFELAIKTQMLEKKIGEVPIISIDRLYGGKSSFRITPWFNEYLKWFIFGIKNLHGIKKKKILVQIPKSTV